LIFYWKKTKNTYIYIKYLINWYMKKRLLLIILLFTFIISITTFYLTWNYIDPYEFPILGLFLLGFTFILWLSSLFAFVLYFFKKVYFRGKVYVQNVLTSFRQWVLISIFIILLFYFQHLWASIYVVALPLGIGLLFLELFYQNLQK
jgi:MFS family permease